MPVALYGEAKYRGVLPQMLVRQLADLTKRVLELDGRDSVYVDESNRFIVARITRLDNMAIVQVNGWIECYLIALKDTSALRLLARRRLFGFEADDSGALRLVDFDYPDIWYDVVAIELIQRLDTHGRP